MKKKVTLLDIANKVGVSKGLVSLALSESDLVNEGTRARILLTAFELGYDISKRKISSEKSNLYSLVCTDASYLNSFFWAEVITGMKNYLIENNIGLDLVVYDSRSDCEFLLNTINKKTKGLIIIASCDKAIYSSLSRLGIPIVILDGNNYYEIDCDRIESSNYYSGYCAAKYLLSNGHRDIAFVGATSLAASFKQRRNGFVDGLPIAEKEVKYIEIIDLPEKYVDSKFETFNRSKVKKILQREDRPTAIFCANDYTALGVKNIMDKLGLKCPDDVSLIGYDNIVLDNNFVNQLTTFDINKKEYGVLAVQALQNRIKNPKEPKKIIQFCSFLVEKSSVKKI